MIFKKQSEPEIIFVSTVPGLGEIKDLQPQPANKFIPSWFKHVPVEPGTVRQCPSFPEYFSSGYIIPAWCDMNIKFISETNSWSWSTPTAQFQIEYHSNDQMLDYVSTNITGQTGHFILKLISPWRIITPKGYSVYQLPVTYHFHKDFTILPGVIRTDIHHGINQQMLIHSVDKEIFIPRGTPLVQYIPFKRNKFNLLTRDANESDIKKITTSHLNLNTQNQFTGSYLRMKRTLSED